MLKSKKVKLFCLPYSGASASMYCKWGDFLDDSIELIPIELAGRGKRFKENLYTNFDDALIDLSSKIEQEINNEPFALFGHSIGCLLAYEIIDILRLKYHKEPVHAFFSSRYPPHINNTKKHIDNMNNNEFIEELFIGKHFSKDLYNDKELQDIFIPILLADFRLIETYRFISRNYKLNINITTFLGTDDEYVTSEEMKLWGTYTSKKCSSYLFQGNHLYITEKWMDVIKIINKELTKNITKK